MSSTFRVATFEDLFSTNAGLRSLGLSQFFVDKDSEGFTLNDNTGVVERMESIPFYVRVDKEGVWLEAA